MTFEFNAEIPDMRVQPFEAVALKTLFIREMEKTAHEIRERAAVRTPVRTRRLQSGYRVYRAGNFPQLRVGITNPVRYFHFVEYGHKIPFPQQGGRVKRVEGVRMLQRSVDEKSGSIQRVQKQIANNVVSTLV